MRVVALRTPRLPASLDWVRLSGLRIGEAAIDLLCERRGDDVSTSIVSRRGEVTLATER